MILTMVIMAVLFATAISFAVFIISDLRQSAQIDESIVAYYGADAGLEQNLFWLRKDAGDREIENIANLKAIKTDDNLANKASWDISKSADSEARFFRQRLENGQSVKLYFLGRADKPMGGAGDNESKSLKIEWHQGEGGTPKLQVAFTQLTPFNDNGNLVFFTDVNKVEISDSEDLRGPSCYDFLDKDIGGNTKNSDYVVELTALGQEGEYIDNLLVTAHNNSVSGSCQVGPVNSDAITNITLRSLGTYNKSKQEIVAQITPKDPVSGLLGFVLFSEEDIAKGY